MIFASTRMRVAATLAFGGLPASHAAAESTGTTAAALAPTLDDAIAFLTRAVAEHAQTSDAPDAQGGYWTNKAAIVLSGDGVTIKEVHDAYSRDDGHWHVTTYLITFNAAEVDIHPGGRPADIVLSCRSAGQCVSVTKTDQSLGRIKLDSDGRTTEQHRAWVIVLNDASYVPRIIKAFQFYQQQAVKPSAF